MRSSQLLSLGFVYLAAATSANPLIPRQATTSTSSASSTSINGPLVETVINGKTTTVPVAVPTDSTTTSGTATSRSSSSGTSSSSKPTGSVSEGAPSVPNDVATSCKNSIDQPICQPHADQQLLVGNTYIVQWSTTAWAANTSIMIGLQYINTTNETNQVAWMSPPYVTQRGLTTLTIEDKWLEGWPARNFSLIWNTYVTDAGKPQNSVNQKAFDVLLTPKPIEHYPPPPQSKMPDKQSLLIALPLTFGMPCIVAFGLCLCMKKHRKIDIGSVMGRRRGYGSGKSRRQRMGIKKGAIRLEDREPAGQEYRDEDVITAAPRAPGWQNQSGHSRDLSLGSLVNDNEPNAFRAEMEKQQTGR